MLRHLMLSFVLLFGAMPAFAQSWIDPETVDPTELHWNLQAEFGLVENTNVYNPSFNIHPDGTFKVLHIHGNTEPRLAPDAPPLDPSRIVGMAYRIHTGDYYIATGGDDGVLYNGNVRSNTIVRKRSLAGLHPTGMGHQGFGDKLIIMSAPPEPTDVRLLAIDPETMEIEERIYAFSQFPDLMQAPEAQKAPTMELLAVEGMVALVRVITPGGPAEEGPFYTITFNTGDIHRVAIKARPSL